MDFVKDDFISLCAHDPLLPLQTHNNWSTAVRAVLGKIIEHYGLPACCLAFETPVGISIKGNYGIDAKFVEHPVGGKSILFHGVDRELPIIIYDALKDVRYCHDPLVEGPPYLRFFIGVPIRLSSTKSVGTLCLMDTEPKTFYSLDDCHFAMQSTKEIAQCLDETNRMSRDFALTLDTLDTIPSRSSLPTMVCSTDGSSTSTPQESPASTPRACI